MTLRNVAFKTPRIAVRAVLMHRNRLLVVNAYRDHRHGLMCAPGGGADPGQSLPDNLRREVQEETGLAVTVGDPCLVNEFHDPDSGFHQIDIYFRCTLAGPAAIDPGWKDVEDIVSDRRWVTETELRALRFKPDSLADVAFGPAGAISYDPLEVIVK